MSENLDVDVGRAPRNEREAAESEGAQGSHQQNGNGTHNSSKGWTRGQRPDWENPRAQQRKEPAQLPYSETILKDPEYKLPFDPWRLFEAMKQRWLWLVAGGVTAGLAMMVLAIWLIDYKVNLELRRREIPNAFRTGESAQNYQPHEFSEQTLMELMRMPELLERVGAGTKPPMPTWKVAKMTKVSPTQNPDTVILTVKGKSDLQGMVDLANAYATEIIRFTREAQSTESSEVNMFLSNRLAVLDADIRVAQRQLQAISPTAGFGNFQKDTEGYLAELAKVDIKLETAKTENEILEARIAIAKDQLAKQTPANDQLQTAQEELRKLLVSFTEKHFAVIQKREEIKRLEQLPARQATNAAPGMNPTVWGQTLANQIRELELQHVGLQKAIEGYQMLFNSQKSQQTNLSVKAMQYAEVQATLESLNLQRKLLERQYQESQIFMGSAMGYYKNLAPASLKNVNRRSRWIKVSLMTCLGGILGFLTVAGIIMIAEAMDTRLKTASDVERTTQLPLLASLGDLQKMDPAAQVHWAFRTLTILKGKLSTSSNQALVCGFISSTHGEGRSTWINLLVNAASQRGLRVLTVDTRPTTAQPEVSSPIKDDPSMSLTRSVLSSPMDVTQQLTDPNSQPVVHIPLPGWVWNLERRTQWQEALAHWKQIDNLVLLVELPPASQPESILLAEKLPQIIWLTGSGQAEASETASQLETLRHAHCNLVGAVLNQEPSTFWKRHLARWFPTTSIAAALLLSSQLIHGVEPITADNARTDASSNLTFSVSGPIKRAAWQQRLTLGPGDALDFTLFGHPELSRTNMVVGPDGRLSYLQAADIPVVGMTIEEVRARMDQELANYYVAARTIVTPVAFNSKKYFVLGKVVTKGVFTMDRPITVIEAVARAHGLETGLYERNTVELADLGHSFLVRDGKKMPVDFQKLFLEGDLSQNIALEPNDYLYFAGTAVNEIYVLGEVMNPGPLGFTPNATMIAALTDRGGFTSRAFRKRVLVIRGSLNQPETFVVDTSAILSAKEPDFKLQPKDIVYVGARPWIKVEELLDAAAEAFIQGAITTWSGANIGPIFTKPILPQL